MSGNAESHNPRADQQPQGLGFNPNDFAYYSPRDIDQDGINDVIHTVDHNGTQQVHHLNDFGNEVILTEADLDGDGILETAVKVLDEKTSIKQVDNNADGEVDQVRFVNNHTGATYQQDEIVNGRVVSTRLDHDGDGVAEVGLEDTDGDGIFDTAIIDSDADGIANTIMVDIDGDGHFDQIATDTDGDGICEDILDARQLGTSGFGNISDYTTMVHHHAAPPPGPDSEFAEETDTTSEHIDYQHLGFDQVET